MSRTNEPARASRHGNGLELARGAGRCATGSEPERHGVLQDTHPPVTR